MIYQEIALRDDRTSMLYTYIHDSEITFQQHMKRPIMIICPGGAYINSSMKEGECVATRFLGMGYHVVVLRYLTYFKERPLPNEKPLVNPQSHYPQQLLDLMRTMKLIHEREDEWGIDIHNIFVLGFSAGAHVTGCLATKWDHETYLNQIEGATAEMMKPTGILIAYPMISATLFYQRELQDFTPSMHALVPYMYDALFGTKDVTQGMLDDVDLTKAVRSDMPPTFVWHTQQDHVTNPCETMEFVMKLLEHEVPCEFHLFMSGDHGTALCDASSAAAPSDINDANAKWVNMAQKWMNSIKK